MKGYKHQTNTFETVLDQVERMIEQIEPGTNIRIGDITGRLNPENRNSDIAKATGMLLKKYGRTYREER